MRWKWILILTGIGLVLAVAIRETTARRNAVRERQMQQTIPPEYKTP